MLPFVPGMLGSRKKGGELRDIYSGVDPVPVHAGRWWEVGSTPFEGARIKEWRPHWSILHKSHAEDAALYGSEEEKWKHNPVLQTRDFRPLTCFRTIEKNYRRYEEYSDMSIYMNRLLHHGCPRIYAAAPVSLTHHIQNCATSLRHS